MHPRVKALLLFRESLRSYAAPHWPCLVSQRDGDRAEPQEPEPLLRVRLYEHRTCSRGRITRKCSAPERFRPTQTCSGSLRAVSAASSRKPRLLTDGRDADWPALSNGKSAGSSLIGCDLLNADQRCKSRSDAGKRQPRRNTHARRSEPAAGRNARRLPGRVDPPPLSRARSPLMEL